MKEKREPRKLHIGCGDVSLAGWVNMDLTPYPAVDVVQDVTQAIPFTDCAFIFAEHFIEHLSFPGAIRFLELCRQALAEPGVLRLTTPNLDWVWATQYHPHQWMEAEQAVQDCLRLNRSFYGWGHQFLYNRQMLQTLLNAAGFAEVEWCERGLSRHPELQGLERHEPYPDEPSLPHVLVVEASGRLSQPMTLPDVRISEYRRDTEMSFHQLQYAALATVRMIKRALRIKNDQ